MSILMRNIIYTKQYVNKILDVQHYGLLKHLTTATASEHFEDPALLTAKPFEEIPTLPTLPFIGNAWLNFPIVGKYKPHLGHKADIHKYETYGDIVRENFGSLNVVSSFVPETMETLFRHEGQFPSRGEFSTLKTYRESRKQWYKSTGLIILQGKDWYDLRTKTQKHLMKPKAIQAYMDPMQDVARDFISLLRAKRDSNYEMENFLENLYKWALESVAYVGLDTRLDCLNPNLTVESDGMKMINSVQTQFDCMNKMEPFAGNFPFWKYFSTPTWKKFEKEADVFSEIAFKYINLSLANLKRRKDEDEDLTLLQSMLMTERLDVSGAMVMVADMLMAGIDTTSNTIGFLIYNLAKNPEKQKKLYQEITELLPNKEDRITPEIFNKLQYLKACMKESIRLMPIVRGNARTFDHDVVISGYRIPAGTVVFCVLQVVCRNEKYFKNADTFLPERWLNKEDKPVNPYAFLPFGIGPRSCIGRRLAELEMICIATEIIRNFKVEYHHEDVDMFTRLINVADKPLRFNFLDH